MRYAIGFDVGGTRLKTGAVTPAGAVEAMGTLDSGYLLEPHELIRTVEAEVRRISNQLGAAPDVIGMGFPGAVDPNLGPVLLPGKIKGLEGYPIVPRLRELLGVPVVADNDGRISIYAEHRYGHARECDWAVAITIGTGVGSGVLLDGRILRDPHLQFGTQMSHIVMQAAGGRLCITGARGTAEMLCSATALEMRVRDGLARGIPSLLSDSYFEDPRLVDFKAIMEAVAVEDRLCVDELAIWRDNLAWLLVSAVHVYAPQMIILSGGPTNAAIQFLKELQEHVDRHLFRYPVGDSVAIRISELSDHAGVLGAAAMAWEWMESNQ